MSVINEVRVQFRGNSIRTGFIWGVQLVNITDICRALGVEVTTTRFNAMYLPETQSFWAPMSDMISGMDDMFKGMESMKDSFPDLLNAIVVFRDMLPDLMNFPTPEFLEYARQGGSENYALYPAQIRRSILTASGVSVTGNSYAVEVPAHLQNKVAILWHVADNALRKSMDLELPYKACFQAMKEAVETVARHA